MGSRETATRADGWPGAASLRRRFEKVNPRHLAAALAVLTAAAPFVARILINARATMGINPASRMDLLTAGAIIGPAVAAGLLAGTTDIDSERIGLAFVAAFGLIAILSPAAAVPAAVAVVGGGTLAAVARWRAVSARRLNWRLAPVVAILAGIGLTLGSAIGLAPAVVRPVGAHLSLLGAAATPALVGHGNRDWALGGAVAGALVAVGLFAPFLTGAVALVGGGIVAVSLPVMAAGLCGLVTTASAGIRLRRPAAILGATLLVVAGVPATLPRALAAVLGVIVLVDLREGRET
jgi:hypothetical protein